MVKSRLALHLGNERAAEIYRELAETVVANVTPRTPENDYEINLCYSPESNGAGSLKNGSRSTIFFPRSREAIWESV